MYFDAHSDIWCDITQRRENGVTNVFDRIHLKNMQKGEAEGSIFVIWVDYPEIGYEKRTHQIMDAIKDELKECDSIRIVHNYEEMLEAKAAGKIYIFIGVEGMAYIGEDLSKIDEYYDYGVRTAMLTWNEENALGAGASSGVYTGLTEAGKAAVMKMQELGMIVDVSHLNEAGFWDVIELAKTPIIASHSNASALCSHPRNLTDDQLRAIAKTGGVVGLNCCCYFTHSDPRQSTVGRLAEHAIHMIDVMGIDHVGCGFDFIDFIEDDNCYGGNGTFTRGLRNFPDAGNLFKALADKGLSEEDIEKIAYKNFHRVIKEVLK